MGNVVLTNGNRIDFVTTTVDVDIFETVDQVGQKTILVDPSSVSLNELGEHRLFVLATMLDSIQGENVLIYHELAQYPFFQRAKEIILEEGAHKGVFRLRRVLEEAKNETIIASDLCVLASVFGDPERVDVKHSRAGLEPQHVIVMIHFGGGTMAHLDYTFSSKEFIELEWSGVKQIIEFNSDEMNPMEPKQYTSLPLQYNVDSILANSESFDVVSHDMKKYQQLVGGAKL